MVTGKTQDVPDFLAQTTNSSYLLIRDLANFVTNSALLAERDDPYSKLGSWRVVFRRYDGVLFEKCMEHSFSSTIPVSISVNLFAER